MTDRIEAGYMEFKPTIWHRLGFGAPYVAPWVDDREGQDDPQYLVSHVTVLMDWKDRLRTLLTGRVGMVVRVHTAVDAKPIASQSSVRVLGPGWTA